MSLLDNIKNILNPSNCVIDNFCKIIEFSHTDIIIRLEKLCKMTEIKYYEIGYPLLDEFKDKLDNLHIAVINLTNSGYVEYPIEQIKDLMKNTVVYKKSICSNFINKIFDPDVENLEEFQYIKKVLLINKTKLKTIVFILKDLKNRLKECIDNYPFSDNIDLKYYVSEFRNYIEIFNNRPYIYKFNT